MFDFYELPLDDNKTIRLAGILSILQDFLDETPWKHETIIKYGLDTEDIFMSHKCQRMGKMEN
jgi:hypothetical protein